MRAGPPERQLDRGGGCVSRGGGVVYVRGGICGYSRGSGVLICI